MNTWSVSPRAIDVKASVMRRRSSSQALRSAGLIIGYWPPTWWAALGKFVLGRNMVMMSR